MKLPVLNICLPVGTLPVGLSDTPLVVFVIFCLFFATFLAINFQVITFSVPAFYFPPGAIYSAANLSVYTGFGVSGQAAKVEALVVYSSQLHNPCGFEFHHQTVHVYEHFWIVLLLL